MESDAKKKSTPATLTTVIAACVVVLIAVALVRMLPYFANRAETDRNARIQAAVDEAAREFDAKDYEFVNYDTYQGIEIGERRVLVEMRLSHGIEISSSSIGTTVEYRDGPNDEFNKKIVIDYVDDAVARKHWVPER